MASHENFQFTQGNIDSRLYQFDVQGIEIEFFPVGIFRFDLELQCNFVVSDFVLFVNILDNAIKNGCRISCGLIEITFTIHLELFR